MGGYIIVAASITDGVKLYASPDLHEFIGAKSLSNMWGGMSNFAIRYGNKRSFNRPNKYRVKDIYCCKILVKLLQILSEVSKMFSQILGRAKFEGG